MEYKLINLYFFLQDGTFRYFCLYFGISILGFLSDELFYSLQLLDVVVRFPALNDVVKAVAVNSSKLLSLAMLAMVIIYIFTTISFFYLQDTLYDYDINAFDSDWVGENLCESMWQCYMTIVDKGVTLGGGIGDWSESVDYGQDRTKYMVKLMHDALFHIIIKVIMLNIVFGIIIDTFAKARE
jgi:inositol 1,4,5-triphosphate receptor type 3